MDKDTYISHVRDDGARLVEAARHAPSARIPSCPDWDMRILVGHVSSVHAWVAEILEGRLQKRPHLRRVDELTGDFDGIAAEYGANLPRLLSALGSTAGDELVWNWFDQKPAPARFWFRRMAQETVMHRVDAELGARLLTPIDASLAVDGISEWLAFLERFISYDPVEQLHGSIGFAANDGEGEWRVALAPDHIEFVSGDTDATVRGPASYLYQWVMNRSDENGSLDLSGDESVIAAWRALKFE